MDRIKFTVNEYQSYPIETDLFERKTAKKAPFYRKMERQNHEISQFAICPACNNPVQIIGLYRKSAHTDKPFAKHDETPIGLGIYNKQAYNYCPYKADRKAFTKDSRKGAIDDIAKEIIDKMVNHFDKIIYLLQKKIGIYISLSLAKEMLNDFFDARAYLYYGASLQNIPLLLAYFSLNKALIGRYISNKELISALEKAPNLYFENNQLRAKCFSNVGFYFTNHKTYIKDHHLTESLLLTVSQKEIIYSEKIIFDNLHFENLLTYHPSTLSEKQETKNKELLIAAKEVALKHGFKY